MMRAALDPRVAALLVCPACGGALADGDDAATCRRCLACARRFPWVGQLPWLLPEPERAREHWCVQHAAEQAKLGAVAALLKEELRLPGLRESTRRRMSKHLQALLEQQKLLSKLLAPLSPSVPEQAARDAASVDEADASGSPTAALARRAPPSLSLSAYYDNLHRDWAWPESDENAQALALVQQVFPATTPAARMLVLGAGACRLARDVHRAQGLALTLATDVNPLMLLAAAKVLAGRSVRLYEFPYSPPDGDRVAVARKLEDPDAAAGTAGFHLAFLDALSPAVANGAFDVVLTPWLIDILPEDPAVLFRRLNTLLRPGGVWVNFGSVMFRHPRPSRRYAIDEVLELAAEAGFAPGEPRRAALPYLRSPDSYFARLETVQAFAAVKRRDVPAPGPTAGSRPVWLVDTARPVPALPCYQSFTQVHKIWSDIAALVDGRRSLDAMAQSFATSHGLAPADALASIRNFLASLYDDWQGEKT